MSAAPDYDFTRPNRRCPQPGLAGLLDAASATVGQLADQAGLDEMADRDVAAVMGALTTLVARLDGLRVQVARTVRERQIWGLRGTRNLGGWLRADPRLADDAWKLARLAAAGPELPKITALLGAGTIGLAQAATACWQIAQLPAVPVPPPVIDGDAAAGRPDGDAAASRPDGDAAAGRPDGDAAASRPDGDAAAGRPDGDAAASQPDGDAAAGRPEGDDWASPHDRSGGTGGSDDAAGWSAAGESPGTGELPASIDPSGGEAWAGLWRAGDVHAAADQLFAAFLPGLDGAQLRQLGAHLREAADTQDRAAGDCDDYARRGLRISRSLHGNGEITGRLHAEATEQVIAAFEQLGRKTSPGDTRTKAQRWADVLTRLTATAPNLPTGPVHPAGAVPDPAGAVPDPAGAVPDPAGAAAEPTGPGDDQPGPGDDQPSDTDPHTGHDHDQGEHRHRGHGSRSAGASRPGGHSRPRAHTDPDQPAGPVPAGFQRPRIIVTVPLDTLLGRPLAPGATLGPGTPLTAEAARRLACDAGIIRLITAPRHPPGPRRHDDHGQDRDSDGEGTAGPPAATAQLTARMAAAIAGLPPPLATPSAVLDIGRQSPGWTPRQRDALYAQYGGHCGFGRCDGPIDVIHHIIHWLHGGKTRIRNGFPSCDYHHWLIHEGGWRIKKHPDGTITTIPPPPGWKPGTIYRNGKPVHEHPDPSGAS